MDVFKTLLLDTPDSINAITGTLQIANGGTGATDAAGARDNLLPDYAGNVGKVLTVNSGATDVEWTTNGAGTVTSVDLTAGTGVSVSGGPITSSGSITVTNTAPDQTVVLTAGTGINTSGTYPSFTVTNSAPDQTVVLTAGTGISTSGTYPSFTVTNSAPDQTVAIAAGTGISVSGSYPSFTVTNSAPSLGGDVVGPASSTDNAVVRFDSTTGKLVQNSGVTISDADLLTTTDLTVNDNTVLGSSNTDTVNFNARVASDINPSADDTYDLGVTGHEWRNLNIDGTANIDSLVADTADIDGGTIDGTAIGGTTPSTVAATTLSASTSVTTPSVTNAGTLALSATGANILTAATNGSERMRIASDGKVNIGLTSNISGNILDVQGGAAAVTAGTGQVQFVHQRTGGTAATWTTYLPSGSTNLRWYNGGDRMTLTDAGVLLTGTTTAPTIAGVASGSSFVRAGAGDWTLTAQSTSASSNRGFVVNYSAAAPNDTGNEMLFCYDSGATRFAVRSNGGIANYQANNVDLSDERVKTAITPAESYLDKMCAIEVVKFKYKDQTHDDYNLGVIAQQVETVAPEFVDADGFDPSRTDVIPLKAIYQTDLSYGILKAVQELAEENKALRKRIEILESLS